MAHEIAAAVRHRAVLHWGDRAMAGHVEEHVAWSAAEAVRKAWKRARSLMLSGQAVAFTTRHFEEIVQP